jgi:hypothetical protein
MQCEVGGRDRLRTRVRRRQMKELDEILQTLNLTTQLVILVLKLIRAIRDLRTTKPRANNTGTSPLILHLRKRVWEAQREPPIRLVRCENSLSAQGVSLRLKINRRESRRMTPPAPRSSEKSRQATTSPSFLRPRLISWTGDADHLIDRGAHVLGCGYMGLCPLYALSSE